MSQRGSLPIAVNYKMIRYYAEFLRAKEYLQSKGIYNGNLSKEVVCLCPLTFNYKIRYDFNTNYGNISNNMRVAQYINTRLGGSTLFGNFYLGEPLSLNYLGRMEGQPGGGGAPLRNRF